VLLSSLVAFQGVRRAANYAATKAWVQSFAEGLALMISEGDGPEVLQGAKVFALDMGAVPAGTVGRRATGAPVRGRRIAADAPQDERGEQQEERSEEAVGRHGRLPG